MNKPMSAKGGSAFGGKKVLFLAGAVLLLAAACNTTSNQSANVNTEGSTQTESTQEQSSENVSNQTTSQTKVDAAINNLTASIEAEESVDLKSDNDIVTSDQTVVNDFKGAVNENQY